jgi:GNAT superfamily N-acetyltransferase
MPQLTYDPPTAPTAGFCQTIRMTEGDQAVGTAVWHAATDANDGVVQILDFNIAEPHRRQGYGKRLMAAVATETLAYHRGRKVAPRRLWVLLRQKRHVIARAFFASQGFTHIATVKDLLTGEDGLVYIRTFD